MNQNVLGRPRRKWENNIKIGPKKKYVRVWTGFNSLMKGSDFELFF
jgi:hypothetical protein